MVFHGGARSRRSSRISSECFADFLTDHPLSDPNYYEDDSKWPRLPLEHVQNYIWVGYPVTIWSTIILKFIRVVMVVTRN